ncbi:MAG: hypothetical protein J6V72_13370 [Kiritimatiellae bacterium]|nr:hypothetical protein [Kiritimatiellia bacterium]
MKRIMKCCLALALGLAVAGCSKESSGGGESGKLQEHKKVQLWKDGPYWAETNIGAENPWDSGYYFWWGDTVGYKRVNEAWFASDGSSSGFPPSRACDTRDKSFSDLLKKGWITADGVLAPEHDAAHVHWGGAWRMPTKLELDDLCKKCDWTWAKTNDVNGYVVRGRGDYASASIFLPCAGCCIGKNLSPLGSSCWSSVPGSDSHDKAWELSFLDLPVDPRILNPSNSTYVGSCRHTSRSIGCPVRPVQGVTK